ncbi:MAG: hypothetical protein JJE52_02565 [Acidimicrobiia bacterium]|nr:hypothetical protein [Acidimicrobiia bacterium]
MFDTREVALPDRLRENDQLRQLADRFRPVTMAERQLLPVADALVPLFPGGGLRRGSIVAIAGSAGGASTSLALAVAAEASGQGSWVALVGMPSVGLVAAAELGVALDRLAVIDTPDRGNWSSVVAALVDAVDLVLVGPARVRAGDARRLAARTRERGAVLLPVGVDWPEAPDLTLTTSATRWEGIGAGHGHLRARRVTVGAAGRRDAARPRSVELWLPAVGGGVASVTAPTVRELRPLPAVGGT